MKNTENKVFKLREKVGDIMGRPCSQEKFGLIMGVSWRTVNRWESDQIKQFDNETLQKLDSLNDILYDDDKLRDLSPYFKSGNLFFINNILCLTTAAGAVTSLMLPIIGISGVSSLLNKFIKLK